MEKIKPFVFYIYLVLLSFSMDQITTDCKTPSTSTYINSIVHHFLSVYLWFGSFIFGNHIIHLSILVLVLLGWNVFGNCILTYHYNKNCNINIRSSHKDIFYRLHKVIKYRNPYLNYRFFITVGIVYDVYHILANTSSADTTPALVE